MKRACIAIVDAAHARLYTYQKLDGEPPLLHEVRDLVNPGRQVHGLFSDSAARKPGVFGGANHAHAGGHGTVDDHRFDHLAELEARFAKTVVAEIERVVNEEGYAHVILIAGPKMLGTVRKEHARLVRDGLVLDEVPQDLGWMTSAQLHDHLAAMSLIAPRQRVALARSR